MKDLKTKRHALGFLQIDPMPTELELSHYYEKTYYQTPVSATYATSYSPEELVYIKNRARVAESVLNRLVDVSAGEPRLADIGCGEGFFAAHFLDLKWQIAAADFSVAGVERQNPQILPYFSQGDIYGILDTWRGQARQFDCINLGNVLEHVREPIALLGRVHRLLAPSGVLRVCVPNDFSAVQLDLLKRGLTAETWICPPDHLSYFNFTTLPGVLREVGFAPMELMTDFPIELFLYNDHSNYSVERSRGKAAHLARVRIDNLLIENAGVDNYISMMKGAANCGFGRTVIGFARKA